MTFFACVKNLQSKDGEPVNHEAGRFGIEWSAGIRKLLRFEPFEQGAVQIFREIVSKLICAIDSTLDAGELCVGGSWRAGLILNVPEVEIGAMLPGHSRKPVGMCQAGFFRRSAVPGRGELVLEPYNCIR